MAISNLKHKFHDLNYFEVEIVFIFIESAINLRAPILYFKHV